jgi:beta-glucosidase
MAQEADVIIAAMGENVMLCGENRDRKGLGLPGRQEEYVEALLATGKPVVLVLFGGRAQVVSGLAERCSAVIQAWYPGEEGGHAVADILYGKVSPSAKLSVSYPNTEVYTPLCYNYQAEQDPRVQWPFGYGLSYTTFEYQHLVMDKEVKTTDECLSLSFEVTNTGGMAADEIAQIYLSPAENSPLTSNLSPLKLQGFARVSLHPGETKTVRVKLYTDQLGYYTRSTSGRLQGKNNGHRQWNIAPGTFVVKIGASSADIRLQQQVVLRGKPISKPLRDHYFSDVTIQQ